MLKPALRAIYPSLTSQFILLTLTTSIASAVSAYELTSVAKQIESDSFRSFEVYGTVTLLYLVMSWLVMSVLTPSLRAISTIRSSEEGLMGTGEFLFLLKGLQWTLILSAVGIRLRDLRRACRRAGAHVGHCDRWSA